MEPLEVFALNEYRERVSGSIPYKSLTWSRKYYEPGQFSMQVPRDVYDPSWEYIYCETRPETGIIQKRRVIDDSTTENGIDTIEISGFFTEQLLNNYIFLIEETEMEQYVIPKPYKTKTREPKVVKDDETGEMYRVATQIRVDDEGNQYEYDVYFGFDSGELYNELPAQGSVSEVEVGLGDGMFEEQIFPNLPDGDYDTHYGNGYYKSKYNYYTQDGKLAIVYPEITQSGTEWKTDKYDIAGFQESGNVIYYDSDGSLKWVNGVVGEGPDSTYRRRLEEWEKLSAANGTDENGNAIAYREVKGPWQLRTDIGEVGVPVDNVHTVITWAQRCFGDSITYDEPDFEGVKKVLEPSLKRLGDLFFDELKTVQASVRLFYSFESDAMVLQAWRGVDRTQDQTKYPWAVFSEDWGTLYGYDASVDNSNYRNKCYVLYEYDEPVWDEEGNPVVNKNAEWDESGNVVSGFNYTVASKKQRGYEIVRLDDDKPDMETYLDLRDETPEADGTWSKESSSEEPDLSGLSKASYDDFRRSLKEKGLQHLENNYSEITTLDSQTLSVSGYMVDYDLGDLVDMSVDSIGIKKKARIVSAEETHESGKSTVSFTFGDETMNKIEKNNLV